MNVKEIRVGGEGRKITRESRVIQIDGEPLPHQIPMSDGTPLADWGPDPITGSTITPRLPQGQGAN